MVTEMILSPRSSRKDELNYSEDLNEAIKSFILSDDPINLNSDFDIVSFINSKFPDINSLDDLHAYSNSLQDDLTRLDDEIFITMRSHATLAMRGVVEIQSVRDSISELSSRINSIRDRSEESEKIVKTVSRDIVFLDTAKKNVSLTINTLKKLVMMVNACEQLAELAGSREYNQTPALILSIKDLESSFEEIKHIPRVDELLKHKNRILNDLKLQLMEDFDLRISLTYDQPSTSSPEGGPRIISSREDIEKIDFNGAAQAVDALGLDVRLEIINKYCLEVIDDYRKQFSPPNGVYVDLVHYEKRFQWLTKALKDFTDKHTNLFPQEWIVNGEICMHFCHETRQHFVEVLSTLTPAMAVSGSDTGIPTSAELMIAVLVKCIELENDMQRRFDKVRAKISKSSTSEFHVLIFQEVISACFEPYLMRWVQSEEKELMDMIHHTKSVGVKGDELMGPQGEGTGMTSTTGTSPPSLDSMDTDPPMVYVSSVNIFARMRASLQRCRQFTSGPIMAELFKVFRKAINGYCDQVLKSRLPSGKQINVSVDDSTRIVCSVIGSCDYCLKMTPFLHKNCMSLLDRSLNVDVSGEIQKLAEIRELAQDSAVACAIGGSEMKNSISSISHLDWWGCGFAANVSPHILRFKSAFQQSMEIFRKCLSENHNRAVIEMVAHKLVGLVNEAIVSAKPISDVGAQQLIVDVAEIKSVLLDSPNIGNRKTHETYIELVHRNLYRLEISLKALSSPACGDKASMKAILNSLDPTLGESAMLDREVDRLLNLRKGPTGSSTIHALAPALFGANSASTPDGSGSDSMYIETKKSADLTPTNQNISSTGIGKISKQDIKAEMSKIGASIMNNKLFGRK